MTHKPSILIPTLPSNCSPWTPVSVVYDDAGTFIRFDVYPVGASLVFVEPRILLHAPLEMLIAGIADTLAKWYEADVQMADITRQTRSFRNFLLLQLNSVKMCCFNIQRERYKRLKQATLNDDFIKVIETIIMLSGMVGGFGDHYGRVAGAHSIHNGLTVLEETHHALHGEKVAYGILVQLVLENKWTEIDQLLVFYRQLGLPASLKDLGVKIINDEVIADVAEKSTVPEESIHVMPGEMTSATVSKAMTDLENIFIPKINWVKIYKKKLTVDSLGKLFFVYKC